jgi:hypothetical protein
MTLSLDGFVSDAHGNVSRLYPDQGELQKTEMLQEATVVGFLLTLKQNHEDNVGKPVSNLIKQEIRTTGAVVMGRNSYNMGDPDSYADSYKFQVPINLLLANRKALGLAAC